jgi:predicted PurR-regulated permease PerM
VVASLPIWKRPRARLGALLALLWLIAAAVVVLAWGTLLPFVLAGMIAYVIDPVVGRLARLRIGKRIVPRWLAVLAVYAVIGALLWLSAVSLLPQVYREAFRGVSQFSAWLSRLTPERIDAWAQSINDYLANHQIPLDVMGDSEGATFSFDLGGEISGLLQSASGSLSGQLGSLVALSRALLIGTVQAIFFVVLLLMMTAFISVDKEAILRFCGSLVPRVWRPDFRRLLGGIDTRLSGVVRGQVTIMVVNGALTLVGLLVLRIPFAFALAALATVLYVVPIFGTILSSVPIVLVALIQSPSRGLLALAWILGIHALESYVLNPKVMGDASRIHPILIVLALIIGERQFGIVGALLAVPVASIVAAIFSFLHRKADELDGELAAAGPVQVSSEAARTPEPPTQRSNA